MNFTKWVIAILLITNHYGYSNQLSQAHFENISVEDGLSEGSVYSIFRDSRGYIWFGTSLGVNRYDGKNFVQYKYNPDNSSTLSNNYVHAIFEDKNGELWFGTEQGLNKLDRLSDKIIRYTSKTNLPNSLSSDHIRTIYQDTTGNFWLGTYGGGLIAFRPESGEIKAYRAKPGDINSLQNNKINAFLNDSKGVYWIGTEGGLSVFDPNTAKFKTYLPKSGNPFAIRGSIVNDIYEDKSGNIWIGTWDGGLNQFDRKTERFTQYFGPGDVTNTLKTNTIRNICEDDYGNLWLASFGGGLIKFNPQTLKTEIFNHLPTDPNSLANDMVWVLLLDNEKNLWAGTFLGGISKVNVGNNRFTKITEECIGGGLTASVNAICEDESGNIWLGTNGGGINSYNRKKGCFGFYLNDLGLQSRVREIYPGSTGLLWVTTDDGVFQFDPITASKKWYGNFAENPNSLSSTASYSLFEDQQKNIWFGVWGLGLYKVSHNQWAQTKPKDAQFDHIVTGSKGLRSQKVWRIKQGKNGDLLLASEAGVAIYNASTDSFTYIYNYQTSDLLEDKQGDIWIGTWGRGLAQYSPKTDSLIFYDSKLGLSHDVIISLLEDNNENIWAATEHGLSCFNPRTKKFTNFYKEDGLLNNEFNVNACEKLRNGDLAFGSPNGVIIFNPDELSENTLTPPIEITDFRIYNQSVTPINIENKKIPITESKEILLFYNQKVFSFEFIALTFNSQNRCLYKYMLEGFDKQWIYTDANNRIATYTNLRKGRYTFRVKASNSYGYWGENDKIITIIIRPPFWDTLLFKIGVILLILTIALLFYYTRVNRIEKQKKNLEIIVEERTREITEKNRLLHQKASELNEANTMLEERQQQVEEQSEELRAQNEELSEVNAVKDKLFSIVAHDLKNPFNSLLGFSDILLKRYDTYDDEKRKSLIKILYDSSKNIFELLNNLLNWSHAQRGSIEFEPKETNITELIKKNIELLKTQAESKQIEIRSDFRSKDIVIKADGNLIDMVLRNLMSNAIKFTFAGGTINVEAGILGPNFVFSIHDNGVGIPKDKIDKLFRKDVYYTTYGTNEEKGTGLGLIMCKEFVSLHNGEIWVESKEEKGSTFSFIIPVEKQ